MSGATREARADEVARLWPAVKAARFVASVEELAAYWEAGAWRVRVSDTGEALVLGAWRAHSDLLAIRGVWAAPQRIPEMVDDAAAVARRQGFASVLSPPVPVSAIGPYEASGMAVVHRVVALQGFAAEIEAAAPPGGVRIREATRSDLLAIADLDAQCFDDFWRYGLPEIADALAHERLSVAVDVVGGLLGYATCSLHGTSATVGRLAVAPDARRRGLGGALLSEAAAWASRQDTFALTMCTQEENAGSRALYARMGLIELPERYVLAVRTV